MKKNVKRLLALLACGAMAVSLAGCGATPDQPSGAGADAGAAGTPDSGAAADTQGGDTTYSLGVILKTTASEYWGYVIAGIEQAEADLGNVEVDVRGASNDTAFEEQLNMVETVAGSNLVQALALAPLQADQVNNVLEGAQMPILAVDTNFEAASTFIGTGHEDAAYQGGQYVAKQIGEGGKVAVLANIQGELTSESRVAGYVRALEEGKCDIVTTQYTDGVGDKAVTVMESVLLSHPDLDAVVCCADDVALGAARAIASVGREGIVVCGFDGISSGVQAVVDGQISCTVAQDPYNMGYQAVVSMVDALEGKELPEFIDTGCNVITPENAEEYLAKLKELVP